MEKFVVIDLETTGHSPAIDDKIIEIGIVVIENNQITEDYSTLINPNRSIPPFITNLTGIEDKDVRYAPKFAEKAAEILELVSNAYFVAHNVPFDLGFLNAELKNNSFSPLSPKVIDTVELSRILFPQAPGFKLNQLADYLEINHSDPHRALSDAYVTAKLLLKLKSKLKSLPYETITHLLQLEPDFNSDIQQLLKTYQDLSVQSKQTDTFNSYRGIAYKKIENNNDHLATVNLSFGKFLDNIYEENGTMEKEMAFYEKRLGQREMSEHIFDMFQAQKHALIEAETGTGKSLAYLLPAIYEAVKSDERLIISTYTTQLQSQLLEEEIPLMKKLIPFSFRVALLKGKSHYISLERFSYSLSIQQEENYDLTLSKAMILVWLTETNTGDIDEIQLPASGYYFFKGISTESEGEIDPKSPWYLRSYYNRACMKAQQADIIITNHALLCADLSNDFNLLPAYNKAIVDEAHHLEHTASKHYGLKLDYVSMQYALNQIGGTNDEGFLSRLIRQYPFIKDKCVSLNWDETFNDAKYELDNLFRYLFQYVVDQQKQSKSFSDTGRVQYRITNDENHEQWKTIKDMASRLTFFFKNLLHDLSLFEQYFEEMEITLKYEKEDLIRHIKVLQTFIDHVEQLLVKDLPELIKWMEIEAYGAKNSVYIYSEPIDVAQLLQEEFFSNKQSIILTSATLTIRNSFTFIKNRLGLTTNDVFTAKIQSPFQYKSQVQLMIPKDFPHINDDDFVYSTCEAILSLAEVTKGRMLILFTSYEMLRKSYQILREMMDLDEYMLIAQGISSGSRTRLKKNFQTFDKAILLGTSSFWEGVDIPGEDLSSLMIVRLPFQPPNHPLFEARAEELKQAGKNAFFDLSLPNAVLRFKQGFGRLIRSTNDRGIVFVCDGRIIKSKYGKFFLESIPEIPILYDTTSNLIEKADEWF